MQSKVKYLEELRVVLDATTRNHATSFDGEYCFDSIVDEGHRCIAIKASLTIENVKPQVSQELRRISPFLQCSPLIVAERTRKRPLQDGVIHTRANLPAINLETLRRILLENVWPVLRAHKGGIHVLVNGCRLKEARETRELSRGDVAEDVGISRRSVYEYERETMNPTIEVALHLERLLGIRLIEPIDFLENVEDAQTLESNMETPPEQSKLAEKALKVFSRLGLYSTITRTTPFDLLTILRKHVVLSYLKQRLERLDEERLSFLVELADVLDQNPAIIASEQSTVESIDGIPVIYLRELLSIHDPNEFISLIRHRRGT